ncbi:hypothetical protein Gotur_016383, partial [Gossypium turneri]
MLWSRDLIDVQKFSNRGIDLYIRLPSSELGKLVFYIDHVCDELHQLIFIFGLDVLLAMFF